QRTCSSAGTIPRIPALGTGVRRLAGQPFADQGPGRGQPRAIPGQERDALGHPDRSGVFACAGADVDAAWRARTDAPGPMKWALSFRCGAMIARSRARSAIQRLESLGVGISTRESASRTQADQKDL